MSFGFQYKQLVVEDALNEAHQKGVIMFAAASNEGANCPVAFPARHPVVFCINSTDGQGVSSSFSPPPQRNQDNFAVLGEAVLSIWPRDLKQGLEQRKSGTSIATPIAAGIAALVLEFVRQEPPLVSQTLKLRYSEMRSIFNLMVFKGTGGHDYLVPWDLFNHKEPDSIQIAASKIKSQIFRC